MRKFKKTGLISFLSVASLCFAALAGVNFGTVSATGVGEAEIDMRVGAEIRLEDPNGIRFRGEISENYFENGKLKDGIEVGMIIIPSSRLEGELTVDAETVAKRVIEKFDFGATENVSEGMVAFNVAMYGIPESDYNTELSARVYLKNGTDYAYSASETIQKRSLAQVASVALARGNEEAVLTEFVDKCNPTFTVAGSAEQTINVTANVGDSITIAPEPSNLVAKFACDSTALSYGFDNVITVAEYSGEAVTATISLGSVEKTLVVDIFKGDNEQQMQDNFVGIKYNNFVSTYGQPEVNACESGGFYFGAAATGVTRLKYKVPFTLKAGSKYVMTFNVVRAGETSLWGNFSIGILNVVTQPGDLKVYSPTMWGYANNGDAKSHATENDYAKSVRLTGSHVNYISYTGSAEFIMKTELSEVWLDLRMTDAKVGNNVLIKEVSINEDVEYRKEQELKTLLGGLGTDNYTNVTFSPTMKIIETDGKVSGLSVTAKNAALRFQYKLNTTLKAGKTYIMSFTVNQTGTIKLWEWLGVGILNVVQNGSASPTMWGYANNGHDTETDYAKDVTLTGSGSGSTTFVQTATFTMKQTLEGITIDFNIPNCTPGELFTLTAFSIEEVV